MKKNLIIIVGLISLFSCKEEISKFLFESSKMSTQIKFSYKYDSDRLISQNEMFYTIMFGQVVDSMITRIEYLYNKQGIVSQKISYTDLENKPTIQHYDYNSNDSLILEMTINQDGDTTDWKEYKYYPDGRKIIFYRYISQMPPSAQNIEEMMAAMKNKVYDTTIYRNEYDYTSGFCKTLRQFDSNDKLVKKILYDYQNSKLVKETHMTYFNSLELMEKTKHYNYSKSISEPDYFSLDSRNDTIESGIYEFKNELVVSTTEVHDYGNMITKFFYENGKRIGMIGTDRKRNFRIVDSYNYFENGDLKEMKSYNEKINAH